MAIVAFHVALPSDRVAASHVIRNVPAEALSVQCRIGQAEPVTLRFIIEDYLRHLKHHLQKIAERVSAASSGDGS